MSNVDIFDHRIKKNYISLYKNFSENKFFWLYGFGWSVISFGFELFNFTWSIDDEIFAYPPGGAVEWIAQGRFSSACILGIFFNNLSLPFFPLLFSQLCMVTTYYLTWVRSNHVQRTLHYFALPLFMASPLLFYVYTFSCLTPVIGFGFLCSATAIYLFGQKRWYTVIAGLLCGGIAVGCYQLFMVSIISLQIVHLLDAILKMTRKDFLKSLYSHILFAFGVLITYSIMLKTVLFFSSIEMTSYIADMVPTRQSISSQSLIDKLIEVAQRGWGYFVKNIWADLNCAVILLIVCGILIILNTLRSSKKIFTFKFIFYVAALGALLVLPLIFFIFNRNSIAGLRTITPIIVAFPAFFVFAWKKSNLHIRSILMLLAVLTLGQFLYLNSKYSYSCYLRNQRDRMIMSDIVNRLLPEIRQKTDQKVPLLIIGGRALDVNEEQFITGKQNEVIGSSVFHWGNGDSQRVIKYFNQFLIFDFRNPEKADYESVKSEISAMPCYPANSSIRFINGVAVVKFSE